MAKITTLLLWLLLLPSLAFSADVTSYSDDFSGTTPWGSGVTYYNCAWNWNPASGNGRIWEQNGNTGWVLVEDDLATPNQWVLHSVAVFATTDRGPMVLSDATGGTSGYWVKVNAGDTDLITVDGDAQVETYSIEDTVSGLDTWTTSDWVGVATNGELLYIWQNPDGDNDSGPSTWGYPDAVITREQTGFSGFPSATTHTYAGIYAKEAWSAWEELYVGTWDNDSIVWGKNLISAVTNDYEQFEVNYSTGEIDDQHGWYEMGATANVFLITGTTQHTTNGSNALMVDSSGSNNWITKAFYGEQSRRIILDGYVRLEDVAANSPQIIISDGPTDVAGNISLQLRSGVTAHFESYSGGGWNAVTSYNVLSADTWYRITAFIDPVAGTFSFWLDGKKTSVGNSCRTASITPDRINIIDTAAAGDDMYIDDMRVYVEPIVGVISPPPILGFPGPFVLGKADYDIEAADATYILAMDGDYILAQDGEYVKAMDSD